MQCCWVVLWPMKVMGDDLHEPWRQGDISSAIPQIQQYAQSAAKSTTCIMPYLCNTWKVKSRTGSKFHRPDFQASTHVWLASQLEVSNVFQSCYVHYARIKSDTHIWFLSLQTGMDVPGVHFSLLPFGFGHLHFGTCRSTFGRLRTGEGFAAEITLTRLLL